MSTLASFFKNSHKKYKVQEKNRCKLCGKSRSYIRFFNLCRICVRTLIGNGKVPGMTKSSW